MNVPFFVTIRLDKTPRHPLTKAVEWLAGCVDWWMLSSHVTLWPVLILLDTCSDICAGAGEVSQVTSKAKNGPEMHVWTCRCCAPFQLQRESYTSYHPSHGLG